MTPLLLGVRRSVFGRLTLAMATLAAAVSLAACNLQFSTGIEAKAAWSRSYKVTDAVTLEIREPNGRITVEATDGNEIQVSATRVARGATEEAAKAAAEKIEIRDSVSPDRVQIDSTAGQQASNDHQRHVDYDVKVPRSISLKITATNSAIEVKSVTGLVKVDAVNSDINLAGVERGADVTTVNGRVVVNLANVGADGVRIKSTNGAIEVGVPSSGKATFAARVTNGAVEVENLQIQTTEKDHRRLEGTIGGGGPDIRLETMNGLIKIVGR